MNKPDLLQLHSSLNEIRKTLEDLVEKDVEIEGLSNTDTVAPEYEDLNTLPTDIHNSKDEHKEAIFTLSDELEEIMYEIQGDQEQLNMKKAKEENSIYN